MPAEHHSVAAVFSPRTFIPSRMMTPAPRKANTRDNLRRTSGAVWRCRHGACIKNGGACRQRISA